MHQSVSLQRVKLTLPTQDHLHPTQRCIWRNQLLRRSPQGWVVGLGRFLSKTHPFHSRNSINH